MSARRRNPSLMPFEESFSRSSRQGHRYKKQLSRPWPLVLCASCRPLALLQTMRHSLSANGLRKQRVRQTLTLVPRCLGVTVQIVDHCARVLSFFRFVHSSSKQVQRFEKNGKRTWTEVGVRISSLN